MERRSFFKRMAGIAGAAAVAGPVLRADDAHDEGEQLVDVAKIYRLQAAFHLAKSTQDMNLMMSLWDVNASLTIKGDPNSPYVGLARISAFLATTGSFTHRRLSLVPSFKIEINPHGDEAFFYEECHDVQNFDQPSRVIASDTYLAGTIRKVEGRWLFWLMFGDGASPLSVDHYYFP